MLLGLSLNSKQSKYDSALFKFDVIKEFVKQSGISDSYAKVSRALTQKGQVNKTNFLQNISSLEGFTLNLDVVKKIQSVENKFSLGTPAALAMKELSSLKLFEHVGTKASKMLDSNDEVRTVDVLLTYLIDSDITVEGLLDSLSASPHSNSNELPIEVTTIHKAKGLEWDNVILVGLQDKRFPSNKDESGFSSNLLELKDKHSAGMKNDESLKEERRLFYVAITRAKKRLYLLHPDDEKLKERVKKAWYSTPKFEVTATRFLYEIDYKNAEDVNNFLKTSNDYSYQKDNVLGAMYTQRFRQLNRDRDDAQ
jgi:DNA helicase-2/ATP-dependent DNA helicase PcrA